jgi:hypothetical protein
MGRATLSHRDINFPLMQIIFSQGAQFRPSDESPQAACHHDRRASRLTLSLLVLATFLMRAIHAGQPIVENYVGRQVPTAMVARNLDRGKGLLRPQLDTAPFPNYFVVEPPLYEVAVVALKRACGLTLEEAGRTVSALAMALAAWGLYELARQRDGTVTASLAVAAFAISPLTIRYGRAFQPDAAMLGAAVAGLACWDRYQSSARWPWLWAGWILIALGIALKISASVLLLPLLLVVAPGRTPRRILSVFSTLLPAALWYGWANHLLSLGEGSRASLDNRSIWLGLIGPSALLQWHTLQIVGWSLLVRAFTPLGMGLALIGLLSRGAIRGNRDALWPVWGISALVALAMLAEKLHHEYYWLLLAPVIAIGIGRALSQLARNSCACAIVVGIALLLLSWAGVRSTWRTPDEWRGLDQAASTVATTVPETAWVVAPEVLLFQADRRGCRMEWSDAAVARAASEWQPGRQVKGPLDLVDYYRSQGARYFADLGSRGADTRRKDLHESIRRRYKVIVDRPDVIIADLADSEVHWNGN